MLKEERAEAKKLQVSQRPLLAATPEDEQNTNLSKHETTPSCADKNRVMNLIMTPLICIIVLDPPS
eukprot:2019905-Amphidinium_carterae.1